MKGSSRPMKMEKNTGLMAAILVMKGFQVMETSVSMGSYGPIERLTLASLKLIEYISMLVLNLLILKKAW